MIITVCSRGNVRSVTAAAAMKDCWGILDVIPVGCDTFSEEMLIILCSMADRVYVVGEIGLLDRFREKTGQGFNYKIEHLDVGQDVWLRPMHASLTERVVNELIELGYSELSPIYGTAKNYIMANAAVK